MTTQRQFLISTALLVYVGILMSTFIGCCIFVTPKTYTTAEMLGSALLCFVWVLPELTLFYSVSYCALHFRDNKYVFLLFLLLSFVVTGAYAIQSLSLVWSNGFIPAVAIENFTEINSIRRGKKYLIIVCLYIAWLIFCISTKKQTTKKTTLISHTLLGIFTFFLVIGQNGSLVFPNTPITQPALGHATPLVSFINNTYQVFGPVEIKRPPLSSKALEQLDLPYNENSQYPFYRSKVRSAQLPFQTAREKLNDYPNVIVLFLEGMSARAIEPYSQRNSAATLNFKKISEDSLTVYNYYNHTLATFRGLQGQMTSSYPSRLGGEHRIPQKYYSNRSLPEILTKYNYDTAFFSAHVASDNITDVLKQLKFDTIFSADVCNTLFHENKANIFNEGLMHDKDLIKSMVSYLQERETQPQGRPFFIGLYNIETHASFDTADDGLKFADGANPVLNTIYNIDAQVGHLYNYLSTSKWKENTILIITADHCHGSEPAFNEIVDENYSGKPIDSIPFIINAPFLDLPKTMDAQHRTSIDFAPTLLNLIGITDEPNSFLGQSLFTKSEREVDFAAFGMNFFAIWKGEVYKQNELPREVAPLGMEYKNYILNFYFHEYNDSVFPRSEDSSLQLSGALQ